MWSVDVVDAEKIARFHYELIVAQNCLMLAFSECSTSVESHAPCLDVQI